MLKVKDLKKILEDLDDEVDVALEGDDGRVYDCCAELKWFIVGEKFPCLVIEKE